MTLTPVEYAPRLVDPQIEERLRIAGAVCIEGPKHCGKTWASLNHANSAMMIGDPSGNFRNRRIVEMEVDRAFVGDSPHLIDEWQEIPSIWDATRSMVDSSTENGRFILTGSSTPKAKGVMHSGAGRISTIRMRTMSLFESGDSDGRASIGSLFSDTFQQSLSTEEVPLEHLISLTVRGGWPRQALSKDEHAYKLTYDYLDAVIRDAVRADGKIRVRKKIEMVLRSMARNESTLASDTKIMADMAEFDESHIDERTFSEYRDVLDRMFMTADQPAFDPNYRSDVRVGKNPKRHLADPALAAAALDMTPEKLLDDLNLFGFLFESMCERDLDVYARSLGGKLFHYRDHQNHEVDAVIEMPDGRWGAFEIKLGMNQVDSGADNLLELRSYMERKGVKRLPSVLAVICGKESSAYRRDDGVYVLPITSLRNRSEILVLRPYIYVDGVTWTMDPFTVAIVLIIIGAALLIVEAFSPGAFMVIPGTVLVILGLVGAAFPDILYSWWSPVIALVVAVPVTLLTVKGYQRLAKPEPPTTTVASSLVGREGTVIVSTETGSMKGKVKIGSDTWSATSDEPIEAGARVVVENGEGVHVHVRRLRTR